jgi:hypothetical protein
MDPWSGYDLLPRHLVACVWWSVIDDKTKVEGPHRASEPGCSVWGLRGSGHEQRRRMVEKDRYIGGPCSLSLWRVLRVASCRRRPMRWSSRWLHLLSKWAWQWRWKDGPPLLWHLQH